MRYSDNEEVLEYFDRLTTKIKELRKERKISHLKLAGILGHDSTSFVARIELRQNGANYNLAHILTIAKAFDCDIRDLMPPSKLT